MVFITTGPWCSSPSLAPGPLRSSSLQAGLSVVVDDQVRRTQFDEPAFLNGQDDLLQVGREQREKIGIGDVTGHDGQEATRRPSEKMAVSEVAVLCDHDTVFLIRSGGYLGVRAAATYREGRDVDGVMSCLAEQGDEVSRKLRVDKELHAALSGVALPMPKAKAANSSAASTSSRSSSG